MNKQYDSRTADKFVVRLPDGLRALVEQSASASETSMNTVFIQALRQYLDNQGRQQLLLDALAAAYVRAGEKEHELRFQLHDREGSRRDHFERAETAERRVVELGGLLRRMVDAAKALKASKHGFNEQQWEQLHAAVAASDTALNPATEDAHCKGSLRLGTGCGKCKRCRDAIDSFSQPDEGASHGQ